MDNPPQSISTSYGDDEQTGTDCNVEFCRLRLTIYELVPRSFAQRVCNGFAQLGLWFTISLLIDSLTSETQVHAV